MLTDRDIAAAVVWKFTLRQGEGQVRYGQLGDTLYRQYLPNGKELTSVYPPRRCEAKLYELAQRQHQQQNG